MSFLLAASLFLLAAVFAFLYFPYTAFDLDSPRVLLAEGLASFCPGVEVALYNEDLDLRGDSADVCLRLPAERFEVLDEAVRDDAHRGEFDLARLDLSPECGWVSFVALLARPEARDVGYVVFGLQMRVDELDNLCRHACSYALCRLAFAEVEARLGLAAAVALVVVYADASIPAEPVVKVLAGEAGLLVCEEAAACANHETYELVSVLANVLSEQRAVRPMHVFVLKPRVRRA